MGLYKVYTHLKYICYGIRISHVQSSRCRVCSLKQKTINELNLVLNACLFTWSITAAALQSLGTVKYSTRLQKNTLKPEGCCVTLCMVY